MTKMRVYVIVNDVMGANEGLYVVIEEVKSKQ